MRRLVFLAVLSAGSLFACSDHELDHPLNKANGFIAHRVAHAGGGIYQKTYTNSYEALDYNAKSGFQYFELDFSFTKDNRLVCLHDWEDSLSDLLGSKHRTE